MNSEVPTAGRNASINANANAVANIGYSAKAAPRPDGFPRLPLYAIGAVLALTLISVTIVRLGNLSTSYISNAATINERALKFEDRVDGGIAVIDATNGGVIDIIAPGSNGFLRGALRGLARERKRMGQGADVPFKLIARTDGRLTLDDPVSKRQVDLKSFGATNARVFEEFLLKPAVINGVTPT